MLEGTMPTTVSNIEQAIERIFPYLFAGSLIWVGLWVAASVWYRRSRGKPIFPSKPTGAVFFERYGSGRSNSSMFTKLGSASNCLSVAITDHALIVQPIFPFNLLFLPELSGLEYNIPRSAIRDVTENKTLLGRTVTVEFTTPELGERSITLRLHNTDQFLKHIAAR
jgi:hypothetical protein